MKYLLDVNVLVALLMAEHSLHGRTVSWVNGLVKRKQANLMTCPITELGFVRIISQPSTFGFAIAEAKELLHRAKMGRVVSISFIADDLAALALPRWVLKSGQVTVGYLAELARKNDGVFATLDSGIPGAFLIPA